jgi:protein-S-isoprenylcysteine O-methyltransferase Ste14
VETFRYGLALVLLITLPPLLFYWPVVHGFIGFWRRVGPWATYVVLLGGAALGAFGLFWVRADLLSVEFGTSWPLVAGGASCLAAAGWFRAMLHRDVTNKLLSGLPELAPERHHQRLVRTGLYARVRHPRYVQFLLALLGYALITNYFAVYVVWLLWLPAMYVISLFEERELRHRFGDEYERYLEEVPRFFPRLRRRSENFA